MDLSKLSNDELLQLDANSSLQSMSDDELRALSAEEQGQTPLSGAVSNDPGVVLEQTKGALKSAGNVMLHGLKLGAEVLTEPIRAPIRKMLGNAEPDWAESVEQTQKETEVFHIDPESRQGDFDKAIGELSKMSRTGTKALLLKIGVPESEAELASITPELALAALGLKGSASAATKKVKSKLTPEVSPEAAKAAHEIPTEPDFVPRKTQPKAGDPVQGALPLEPPFELTGEVNPYAPKEPSPAKQAQALKSEAKTNEIADLMRKSDEEALKKAEMDHDFATNEQSARWKKVTEDEGFKKISEENYQRVVEGLRGKDLPETSMGLAMKEALKKGGGTVTEMFTLQPKMGAELFERILNKRFSGLLGETTARFLSKIPEDSRSIVKIMPVDTFESLYTIKGFGEAGKPPGPGPFSKIALTEVPQIAVRYDGLRNGYKVENYSGQHLSREYANYGHKEMPVIIEDLTGSLRKDNPKDLLGMGGERVPNPLYREDVKLPAAGQTRLSIVRGTKDSVVEMWTLQPKMANQAIRGAYGAWRRYADGLPRPEGVGTTLTERLAGASMESSLDFMDRMAREPSPEGSKNFRVPLGLSSSSYRITNPWIRNMGNQLYETAMHFDTKLKDAFRFEHSLNARLQPGYDALGKVYLKWLDTRLKVAEFKQDMGILLEMERDPAAWRQGAEWYPTAIQLEGMGLAPDAARAWRTVFDGMEKTWDVLEATLGATGLRAPARVPGYLPHFIRGPYRIEVYREVPAPTVKDPLAMRTEYSHEFGSFSKRESNAQFEHIQNTLKGNQDGWMARQVESSPHTSKVQEMIEGLDRAQSIQAIAGAMTNLISAVYESAAKGIIGAALERSTIPKQGHLLERTQAAPGSLFQLSYNQMVEAFKAMQTATEATNAWSARVKFVTETLFPLEHSGLLENRAMKNVLRKWMHSYMKVSDTVWKNADAWVKDKLLAVGLDPGLAHSLTEVINSTFAKIYLVGSIPFYVVNVLQTSMVLPVLLSKQAFGLAVGERTGSVTKALSDMRTHDLSNVMRMDTSASPVLKWAQDNGYVAPQFIEHIDPSKWQDPVAKAIDTRTRAMAFMTAFRYYDQIMPREKALRAAGEAANEVGVPYSQQIGAPTILSQLPMIARPLAIFATFQQHILGTLNNQLSIAKLGAKNRNPAGVAKAAQAAIGMQAMNVALYGLGGMSLITNYDEIARLLNKTFNLEMPTTNELSRSLDEMLGTGGLLQYGTVSNTLGYDVSTSASGVGMQLPGAGAKMYGSLFEMGVLGGKWAYRQKAPTKQEQWDVARTMPQHYAGTAELLIRYGAFDTAALPNVHRKGIKRTDTDQILRAAFGLRSIDEKAYLASERNIEMREARIASEGATLSQYIQDRGLSDKDNQRRLREFANEYQKDPETFIRGFLTFIEQRDLTPNERRAVKATGGTSASRTFNDYLKQRKLEPSQGVNQ